MHCLSDAVVAGTCVCVCVCWSVRTAGVGVLEALVGTNGKTEIELCSFFLTINVYICLYYENF